MIEGTRVHLADAGQYVRESEVRGDLRFELIELGRIAVEEIEHVLSSTHRTLDPAQRVAVDQLAQTCQRNQQLVGGRSETLTQGGGLSCNVV